MHECIAYIAPPDAVVEMDMPESNDTGNTEEYSDLPVADNDLQRVPGYTKRRFADLGPPLSTLPPVWVCPCRRILADVDGA